MGVGGEKVDGRDVVERSMAVFFRNALIRYTPSPLWLIAITGPLVLACGEDAPQPPGNAVAFCTAWGKAACNDFAMDRCGSPDEDQCVEYQQEDCLRRVDAEKYDKAGADECLNAVKAAYDDAKIDGEEWATLFELSGPCSGVQSSPADPGDSCSKDSDCDVAAGQSCVLRPAKNAKGQCYEPEPATGGESCDDPQVQCAEGFYCDGEHCLASGKKGGDCSAKEPCKDGLRCVDDGDTATCEEKLELRATCASNDECQSGLCAAASNGKKGCATSVLLDFGNSICDPFGPPVGASSARDGADAGG